MSNVVSYPMKKLTPEQYRAREQWYREHSSKLKGLEEVCTDKKPRAQKNKAP